MISCVSTLKRQQSDTNTHMTLNLSICAMNKGTVHEERVIGISLKLQPKYALCVVLKRLSDVTYFI